jgi:hypothetical protein
MSPLLSSCSPMKPSGGRDAQLQSPARFFCVHPFVEEHPESVFIMQTDVDVKTDTTAKLHTGLRFARSAFLPMDTPGIPLTHMIPIKPNLTSSQTRDKDYSLESGMGIVTDPYFVEGMIEGMKELGISGDRFYLREVNGPEDFRLRGYTEMARRTGADLRDLSENVRTIDQDNINWTDVPNGVVHDKIPYLWPINAPDTFFINVAKLKTHDTGMTLCCKNHQGSIADPYQRFCHSTGAFEQFQYDHLVPDTAKTCELLHDRHVDRGLPYWDKLNEPGKEKNLWLDTWCQRTLDNLSATNMGLCVIEGIYGRDDAFLSGPNPPLHNTAGKREAWDYMTNVIVFGKDPILVDTIGHWLAGHEPGQFGFFHIAVERGLSMVIDPRKIPVYMWDDGTATRTPLERFPRTPLLSSYIPKDRYSSAQGTHSSLYYMYDDPFDYSTLDESPVSDTFTAGSRVYDHVNTHPENPFIFIEFTLPHSDYARIDILDGNGGHIETIVNGYRQKGGHCASWNVVNRPMGTYQYRFRFRDFTEIKRIEITA